MDEPCSIQASYPSYIKKNETTEIVSQKSNFLGSHHPLKTHCLFFVVIVYSAIPHIVRSQFRPRSELCLKSHQDSHICIPYGRFPR